MKYHLLSAALLMSALALYALGVSSGITAVLAIGAGVEILFWVRMLRGRRHPASTIAATHR
jgi:hypothetical protein